MNKKLKLGLAGLLAGTMTFASTWNITGNKPDNLTSQEYQDLVSTISTNEVLDSGSITNHSRYWGTNGIANGWVSIYDGTNLESTVQADSNGNWVADIHLEDGTTFDTYHNDGTNFYYGGSNTHSVGGFDQITNDVGEAIATTNQYSTTLDNNFNLNWAPTVSGGVYEVWSTQDLTKGFTNLESTVTSLTENCSYAITNHANKSQEFYKIKTKQ